MYFSANNIVLFKQSSFSKLCPVRNTFLWVHRWKTTLVLEITVHVRGVASLVEFVGVAKNPAAIVSSVSFLGRFSSVRSSANCSPDSCVHRKDNGSLLRRFHSGVPDQEDSFVTSKQRIREPLRMKKSSFLSRGTITILTNNEAA